MSSATGEIASPPTSRAKGVREQLRRVFSFPVFVGAMVSLAAALVTTLWEPGPVIAGRVVVEGDTWWHLVVGERILSTHTWPTVVSRWFPVYKRERDHPVADTVLVSIVTLGIISFFPLGQSWKR
jgi:hypothetical protein